MSGRAWRLTAALVLAILLALVAVNLMRAYPMVNQDVAFNLVTGRKIGAGSALYIDWIDNNPPSIYLLSAAIASAAPGIRGELALYFGLLLVMGGAGCVALSRLPWSETRRAAALASYLFVLTGCGLSGFEFGQREQVFLVAFVPWAAWRASGAPVRAAGLVAAAAVGYLAAMKPHFIVLLAWIEAVNTVASRRPSLGTWFALASGVVLPFVLLGLLEPRSIAAFFLELVPYEVTGGPAAYDAPLSRFFTVGGWTLGGSVLAAAALAVALRRGWVPVQDVVSLGGLLVLANLAVLEQHRFYAYHFFLPVGVAALTLGWVVGHGLERLPEGRRSVEGLAVGAVGLSLIASNIVELGREWLLGTPPPGVAAEALLRDQQRVLFVGTSVEHVYAYYYSGVEPVGRWALDFTLPEILAERDPGRRAAALDVYGSELADAIASERPGAIVFTASNQGLAPFRRYTFPAHYTALHPYIPHHDYDLSLIEVQGTWVVLLRKDGVRSP